MKLQEADQAIYQNLLKAEFGIEKESLRVGADGYLADTKHPNIRNRGISRDFGESQVEFISGVSANLQDACVEICCLQDIVEQAVALRPTGKEYIWTYSNPPLYHGEDSIRIAEFAGVKKQKTTYREYLAQKYGKVKMLFSGVHLNYSMPQKFFEFLQKKEPRFSYKQLKSEWYVRLGDILMSDSWLLVALTSASPVADSQFLDGLRVPPEERSSYASFRNSIYGYWNPFIPELCYTDFTSYLDSMNQYVKRKEIDSIQELYYPIRLKPAGENTLKRLAQNGVNHIELRMLDLNPMCCAGVAKRDLVFIHLLTAYRTAKLLWGDGQKEFLQSDKERVMYHKIAARYSFWEENPKFKKYALGLLKEMKEFYANYEEDTKCFIPNDYNIFEVLSFEEEKILNPDKRYANQLRKQYESGYIKARMWEITGEEGEFH